MRSEKILRIKMFIDDVRNFLRKSVEEFEEGLKTNDQYKICDAAEKMWNAVINAINALILHKLDIVPTSHWERRKLLEKLENEDPRIEELRIRDRYGARERYLHEMTFYDGIIDIDMLKREISKVEKYIADIE
ncbi:MAG: hypothetical protein GU359_04455, partial [Desulfurococcales archaeon]|nr:hypothetical protein [Desulfurococcales archaeon]